jgi:adenylate cyclase, class 2
MRVMLAGALGVIAEIRKVRTLLMRRNVRLHLDCVDGLGSFGEIEAVIAPDEKPEGFRAEVAGILATLEIAPGDLIRKSYFELVNGG